MACFASIMGSDNVCELRFGETAATYFKERSYDRADHIAQEAVGRDEEIRFGLGDLHPFRFANITDGRFDIRVRAAERGEVLLTEQ